MPTDIKEAKILANLTAEERRHLDGGEPAPEAEISDEPEYRADPSPILAPTPLPNVDEVMRQLAHAEDNLARQFDEGDITAREYREGLNRLSDQRDEVRWALRKNDLAHEMKETAEKAAWHREVEAFMTRGPGADLTKSHAAMVAFDDIVKKVTADPANDRLSDRAQLQKAFKIYTQDMAKAGIGSADQIETARALGDMGGGRGGADFGSIDTMIARGDLAGVERALSRMSREERDRYGY